MNRQDVKNTLLSSAKVAEPAHFALFIHSLSGGGAQRRTVMLANGFAERGHQVDLVVVSGQGPFRSQLSPQVRLVELDVRGSHLPIARGRGSQLLGSVAPLSRYLRQVQPDLLMSAASHTNLYAIWARMLSRTGIPLVLRISNNLSRSAWNRKRLPKVISPFLGAVFLRRADGFIAVSGGVADDFARVTGTARDRIETIYNPVVTPAMQRLALEAVDHPWFKPGEPPVILGVGRLVAQKDFPTLIRAFAKVRAMRPARLVVLGRAKKPERRERLEALARRLGVDKDVALLGFVANPFAFMTRAGVLVLSSAWEGLPGVLIEAMACSCPIVSTDCPSGPAEILDGGKYGPLVPVGDAAAMADAIASVLAKPLSGDVLRARAASFSVPRAVERYLDVLLPLARERRQAKQAADLSLAAMPVG